MNDTSKDDDLIKDGGNLRPFLYILKKEHRRLHGHALAEARFARVVTKGHAKDYIKEIGQLIKNERRNNRARKAPPVSHATDTTTATVIPKRKCLSFIFSALFFALLFLSAVLIAMNTASQSILLNPHPASGAPAISLLNDRSDANKEIAMQLGDTISVLLDKDSFKSGKTYQLYFDNVLLSGNQPTIIPAQSGVDATAGLYQVEFQLQRGDDPGNSWDRIFQKLKSLKPASVSVCTATKEDGAPLTCVSKVQFHTLSQAKVWIWVILAVVVLGIFIHQISLGNSALLRDAHPAKADPDNRPKLAAYSLSRIQMAFWFLSIVLAFMFIWLATGEIPVLNTTTLTLLGLGSGTSLGAFAIDESNGQDAPESSGSLLNDILSNADGTGFHRLQMFIWTMVMGIVFISGVFSTISMPEFSNTLLALMGISSSTYLGFKISEQKQAKNDNGIPSATTAPPGK